MAEERQVQLVAIAKERGKMSEWLGSLPPRVALRISAEPAELAELLPAAEVVLAWEVPFPPLEELWPLATGVRWVHAPWAGVNHLLFAAMVEHPCILTNARGVFDVPMAEYTVGLVLAMAKRFPEMLRDQAARTWHHRTNEIVAGKTAVIVGVGSIGGAIARRLRALDMRVVGVRRSAEPSPDCDVTYPRQRLHEALAEADYLILATPLTPETKGLIGAAELARLKPSARLINVGRGAALDQGALVAALREGRLAGAALDVFAQEPLPPEDPLWDLPNVIISPHQSGDDHDWKARSLATFTENLARYLAGQPLQNVVDKHRGY